MTLLSEQELDHLAKLAKLKLSPEEKQKFLGNMEAIINFLGQLENVEESSNHWEERIHNFSETESFENPRSLLKNSQHQKSDFISVKTAIAE